MEEPIRVPEDYSGEVIDLTSDAEMLEFERRLPPPFDAYLYIRAPDSYTIVSHLTINLTALGITINVSLKCVVCIQCCRAVDYTALHDHIHSHTSYIDIPDTLSRDLAEEFDLALLANTEYPSIAIPPVFGIPIQTEVFYFCGACHRGYHDMETLRVHQASRCHAPRKARSAYMAYAQCLTKGKNKRWFPVDISGLERRKDAQPDYASLFENTHPPPVDFSKLPIQNLDDEQNLGQFLFREGWLAFMDGFTPEEMVEGSRGITADDEPWAIALKGASLRFLTKIQPLIDEQQTFGLLKAIAEICPSYVFIFL